MTDAFCALAAERGVVVVLNLYERDGEHCYDSSPVIDADGSLLGVTRMVHITDYACFHEQGYYAPGDTGAPVYDTAVGRVGVAICYDRHYPEYMRALALDGADLVVVPQAGAVGEWPEGLYEAEMTGRRLPERLLHRAVQPGRRRRLSHLRRRVLRLRPAGVVRARAGGTEEILYCGIDLEAARRSHARKLFLRDRRPELYADWIS